MTPNFSHAHSSHSSSPRSKQFVFVQHVHVSYTMQPPLETNACTCNRTTCKQTKAPKKHGKKRERSKLQRAARKLGVFNKKLCVGDGGSGGIFIGMPTNE